MGPKPMSLTYCREYLLCFPVEYFKSHPEHPEPENGSIPCRTGLWSCECISTITEKKYFFNMLYFLLLFFFNMINRIMYRVLCLAGNMPNHHKKSPQEKIYKPNPNHDQNMLEAYNAVKNGMRIAEAARHFGVPRTTLSDRY